MKNKKIMFILITVIALVLMIILVVSMFRTPEEELLEPIGMETPAPEIISFGEVGGVEPLVSFTNKSEFAEECILPRYAKQSINKYLEMYLTYYLTISEGTTYKVDYLPGSFKDHEVSPSFRVIVHLSDEEALPIDCIYMLSKEEYAFDSKLDD